jgi:serine/threonine protein kinase
MSNNQRNNQRNNQSVKILFTLLPKLINRSITSAEKGVVAAQLDVLRNVKITQNEYDTLFNMLDQITSTNSRKKIENQLPMMPNEQKKKRKFQLEQKLDTDQIYYIRAVLLKLQGEPLVTTFISPEFSGTFPNGKSFEDFIKEKLYNQYPIIGQGGFGKVFRLDFPEQSFVLKGMRLQNDYYLTSVKNEIEALQKVIGKWYAVQLLASSIIIDENLELGRIGSAYILYPFIPGETLAEYQTKDHPEEEELAIYSDLIDAVHELHSKIGLLHSDIKPQNIWIPTNRDIRPFLLDFGLVQSLECQHANTCGTPFFWSEKRYLSQVQTAQRMTPGINWLALARTFGSELPNKNARLLPPLRERFKQLYHVTNENMINKNTLSRTLHSQNHIQRMNRSANRTNRNRNQNHRNTKKMKR